MLSTTREQLERPKARIGSCCAHAVRLPALLPPPDDAVAVPEKSSLFCVVFCPSEVPKTTAAHTGSSGTYERGIDRKIPLLHCRPISLSNSLLS